MKSTPHWHFQRFAGIFSRIYSTALNPLYYLGAVSVAMFVIACISGVYVFLFYDVDPAGAYESVERLSANPVGAAMRSIHRYSSDLLVIFVLLHFFQTLLTGKYRRVLSWASGIVSFLIVLIIGVTGFILVWDEKGKLIGYLTAKFFSVLPFFDATMAGAFISNNLDMIGGFFKVSLFGHIFFSIFLVIVIWIHVMRLAKPRVFPPRTLWIYLGMALLVPVFVFPVASDPPAQEHFIPYHTTFDWYYLYGYYLMKVFSLEANWLLLVCSGVFFAMVPFIKRAVPKKPAVIDLDNCDACNRCAEDCPYGAIDMLIHEGERKAILNPAKCISCGICFASCKEGAITMEGIDMPVEPLVPQREGLSVISCSQFAEVPMPEGVKVHRESVPCLGDIHSQHVENLLESKSDGILVLGCEHCYYRYGRTWLTDRLMRKRPPFVEKQMPMHRIRIMTPNRFSEKEVTGFLDELKQGAGSNGAAGEPRVLDFFRARHIPAVLIFCLFFLAMPLLSHLNISFFDKQENMLVLNFRYVSSPTEFKHIESSDRQMQFGKPVVTRRSPVLVTVVTEAGVELFSKEYQPRGLRNDIALFVYEEIRTTEAVVSVRLTELDYPSRPPVKLEGVTLSSTDGTIVVTEENQFVVLGD